MAKYNIKKVKILPEKTEEPSENQLYLNTLLKYTNSEIKKVNKYLSDLNKNKRIIKQLIKEVK